MTPTVHDLLVMLGNLRYRLEPRLHAGGISLHWNVIDTERIASLGPMEVTDITRIMQEACTNAIKHSRATDMSLPCLMQTGKRSSSPSATTAAATTRMRHMMGSV